MQEAPNLKKKDEQQERGNYDSAVYMGVMRQNGLFSLSLLRYKKVAPLETFANEKRKFNSCHHPLKIFKKLLDKRNKV